MTTKTNLEDAQSQLPDFSDAAKWEMLLACPLCGGSDYHTLMLARDLHYHNPGRFPIAECNTCKLHFLNPMPTMEYLRTAYPTNYYAYTPVIPKSKRARRLKQVKRFFRYMLYYRSWTGDPNFETPGTMLDVGCGAGTFLATMLEKGWRAYGVDFDERAAQLGRQEGIEIFGGTIRDANYPSAYFDYVRSNHSFEHIRDPREVLREIRRVIKPTGLLFIGVPNVNGLMATFWKDRWWYRGAPVHTFGYNPDTLCRLLEQEGFELVSVRYNSTFAGILGSLQVHLNRKNGKGSEEGWIVGNPVLRLLGHWAARLTDFMRTGDCMEITVRCKQNPR